MHVPQADLCRKIERYPAPLEERCEKGTVLLGIHDTHGASHSKPASPRTTKNERHPNRATAIPPTSMPSAGPSASPVIIIALAKPRRLSMLEFLETLPPGPRAFETWEEYEQHLREEKDAWER